MPTPIIDGDLWMTEMLAGQATTTAALATLIEQMTDLIARITPMSTTPFEEITALQLATLDVSLVPNSRLTSTGAPMPVTTFTGAVNGGQYRFITVGGAGSIVPPANHTLAADWSTNAPDAIDYPYCLYLAHFDGTTWFWTRVKLATPAA